MPKYDKNQYSLQKVYTWYKSQVDTPEEYSVFKEVLDTWGKLVCEYLLLGKDIKLQQGLSTIGMRKKIVRTYVDRKASKEAGKLVIKPNSHSSYYVTTLYWGRRYATVSTSGWSFKAAQHLSRSVAVVMKKPFGHTRYVKRAMVSRDKAKAKQIYFNKTY